VWQKEEGGRDKGEEAVEGEGEGGVVEGQGEEDLGPSKVRRKGGREGGREGARGGGRTYREAVMHA
jgi:hypothetical protein